MAQLIVGDDAVFDAMAAMSRPQTTASMQVMANIQNAYQCAFGHIQNAITQRVEAVQQEFAQSNAYQRAAAIIDKVKGMFLPDGYCKLEENWMLQYCPAPMIRGIMANPLVQQYYYENRISGYAGQYQPLYSTQVPLEQHRDYRLVTDGIVMENDDGELEVSYYSDNMFDDDDYDNLTEVQQNMFMKSWLHAEYALAEGIDITDENGNEIM